MLKALELKKGDQCYFLGTNELQEKELECFCESVKDEKCYSDRIPIYRKPTTRIKCNTRLKITREKRGRVESE